MQKTIASIVAAGTLISGGVDASILNENVQPVAVSLAGNAVEFKQENNVAETNFPWKDQSGFKVKYDLGEPTLTERFLDKRKKNILVETVDFGEGGFKIDIILNEKPSTNVFCYQIEGWEDYDFFYQPALTAEEIAQGASRPEEIVGSYAVYHKTLANHKIGGENYATGKVMHIPFPYVWEMDNPTTTLQRAENLTYNNGSLCVTVQQEFLDKAKYPVRVDPTFGYTTAGASNVDGVNSGVVAYRYTAPSDVDTVSKISFWSQTPDTSTNFKGGIWLQSTLALVSNGVGSAVAGGFGAWTDTTYSSMPSLSASTDYYIGVVQLAGGGLKSRVYYDTGGTSNYSVDNVVNNYTTPTNLSADGTGTRIYSIYATYNVYVPPPPPPGDPYGYATSTTMTNGLIISDGVIFQ
jgi:hypothetical protein